MVRSAFARLAILTVTLGACGAEPTPPGALTIQLNEIPEVTAMPTITVSGEVQRTPDRCCRLRNPL